MRGGHDAGVRRAVATERARSQPMTTSTTTTASGARATRRTVGLGPPHQSTDPADVTAPMLAAGRRAPGKLHQRPNITERRAPPPLARDIVARHCDR